MEKGCAARSEENVLVAVMQSARTCLFGTDISIWYYSVENWGNFEMAYPSRRTR